MQQTKLYHTGGVTGEMIDNNTMNEILHQQLLATYSGILFNYQEFDNGNDQTISYDFDCPQYAILQEKYNLQQIAGRGSDFAKAKRLLHHFAPRLTHCDWYDNHIACNAIDLLEYSYNNQDHGINCLNKSKILQECCMALGIFARRVVIMPYSPYDCDNHVVTEIFDTTLNKWIMLDPTTDGYFVDSNNMPLSLLDIRDNLASDQFVTFVSTTDRQKDLARLHSKHLDNIVYISKNIFFFLVDRISTFGTKGGSLTFVPKGYSQKANAIANMQYRIAHLPEEYKDYQEAFEEMLDQMQCEEDTATTNIASMRQSPIQ